MIKKLILQDKISKDEIQFEDEVIIEKEEINVLLVGLNLNEKFGLKYKNDSYYDTYLNYNYMKDKTYIDIIYVDDRDRIYYKYIPKVEEIKMFKDKLEQYINEKYKQSLKDFIKENEEEFE